MLHTQHPHWATSACVWRWFRLLRWRGGYFLYYGAILGGGLKASPYLSEVLPGGSSSPERSTQHPPSKKKGIPSYVFSLATKLQTSGPQSPTKPKKPTLSPPSAFYIKQPASKNRALSRFPHYNPVGELVSMRGAHTAVRTPRILVAKNISKYYAASRYLTRTVFTQLLVPRHRAGSPKHTDRKVRP